MSDLQATLSAAAAGERRACVRRLLVRPLLGQREDPETYAMAIRHRQALAAWLAEHTGWHLAVDETGGVVRLHKTPAHRDTTRPATPGGRDAKPFTPRRYALTCLALAALDERPGQTTLRRLAQSVEGASREQEGLEPFDPTRYAERRAFVDPALAPAMRQASRSVAEEQLLDLLLDDLAR